MIFRIISTVKVLIIIVKEHFLWLCVCVCRSMLRVFTGISVIELEQERGEINHSEGALTPGPRQSIRPHA